MTSKTSPFQYTSKLLRHLNTIDSHYAVLGFSEQMLKHNAGFLLGTKTYIQLTMQVELSAALLKEAVSRNIWLKANAEQINEMTLRINGITRITNDSR